MGRISVNRRDFGRSLIGALALSGASPSARANQAAWRPRYALASSLYGTLALADILSEVAQVGASHIDLWPRVHGNQREQVETLGHEKFAEMLAAARVKLGIVTRYDLGPLRLREEFEFAQKFGCSLVVTASGGPAGLSGTALKEAISNLVRQLEPHLKLAEQRGVTVGIENHSSSLVESPDGIRWLAEMAAHKPLGIALAPYHLPQEPALISKLIEDVEDKLVNFYAWQHGLGASETRPKADELLQLPGRGSLDFRPIVAGLAKTRYQGFTEIFMHPVPRGVPILNTVGAITSEINRAREHLEACITE